MTKFTAVLATAGSMEEAEKISGKLLDEKKAACVNIIPGIKSLFWWKGKKEHGEEVLMVVKSRIEILDEVMNIIKENHSYDVPEIIALPIAGGNEDYLKWLGSEIE
jgi:periplasmic divalent cation tolerance protein